MRGGRPRPRDEEHRREHQPARRFPEPVRNRIQSPPAATVPDGARSLGIRVPGGVDFSIGRTGNFGGKIPAEHCPRPRSSTRPPAPCPLPTTRFTRAPRRTGSWEPVSWRQRKRKPEAAHRGSKGRKGPVRPRHLPLLGPGPAGEEVHCAVPPHPLLPLVRDCMPMSWGGAGGCYPQQEAQVCGLRWLPWQSDGTSARRGPTGGSPSASPAHRSVGPADAGRR